MNPLFLQSVKPNEIAEMQVSKWLDSFVLLDSEEMKKLIESLGDFSIFSILGVQLKGQGQISKDEFLNIYADYINQLKQSKLVEEVKYKYHFTSLWTKTSHILKSLDISPEKHIIKPYYPVVFVKPHLTSYSKDLHKFQSTTFGKNSISWGLQFSYPQLFQNPETQEIQTCYLNDHFPNSQLFYQIQQWIRQNTLATPFLVEDKRLNATIRIGKQCLDWIHSHPQLMLYGIKVRSLK